MVLENVATDRMARTLTRIRISRVAAFYLIWTLFVEQSRKAEELRGQAAQTMMRTIQRMASLVVSNAFRRWAITVGAKQQQEVGARLLVRVAARMRSASLLSAYNGWRTHVTEQQMEERNRAETLTGTMSRTLRKVTSLQVARAFKTWVSAVNMVHLC